MKIPKIVKLGLSIAVVAMFIGCGGSDSNKDNTSSSLTDGGGTSDVVTNKKPKANAGKDKVIIVNQTVTLIGKGTDSDGTISSYEWKEGNKVLAKKAQLTYTPTTIGKHTLVLKVTDNDGDSASDTIIVTAKKAVEGNQPPKANAGADKSITVNETITLIGKGTDSDGTIIDYEWKKGSDVLATTASFDYTPSVVGKDTLTLTVTDNDGDFASDTVVITVNKVIEGNQPPKANAGKDQSVTVNSSIKLTGIGTDSDGTIVAYEWKKGSKVLSTDASFTYTPNKVGKDTLTFTVTDNDGSKTSDSVVITVNKGTSSNKPLILTIKVNDRFDKFILAVKDDLGYNYNYNIDWGDGESTQGVTEDARHYYDKEGVHTIKITGDFPAFDFTQVVSLEQWGSIKWKSMKGAFKKCASLKINATDVPDFSDVNDTSYMFSGASSQCLPKTMSQWNMSSVKNMESMFDWTKLNQDISSWDVSSVTNMKNMFYGSYYNGDFSKWNVAKVTNMEKIFEDAKLSTTNYDKLLNAWSKLNLQKNVTFGLTEGSNYYNNVVVGTQYTKAGKEARKLIQSKFHWTIKDSGIDIYNMGDFKPFIGVWKTTSYDNTITMSVYNEFFQYNIDWGDGTSDNNVTETKKHTYMSEGNYTITISGNYPYSHYSNKHYLVDVKQWGDNEWKDISFQESPEIIISASDAPNLLAVRSMRWMFAETTFNSPINHWNVSNVKNMGNLFYDNKEFNQDLSSWDISNVTNMDWMFYGATKFNQDISSWDVSNIKNMDRMFYDATKFNQDISSWDVSNVKNMDNMFSYANSFNQDLSNWNIQNIEGLSAFDKARGFNQDLSAWDFTKVNYIGIEDSNISTENYSKLLISLNQQDIKDNVSVHAGSIKYNKNAQSARFELINKHGWHFSDGGLAE
ncbi:Chitinase [hydrothermal vent metagenome]|uniref:Chitinase n=1 Tax=hydrothermal vent metagenome TaxID=652676 RepID=A0A1W1BUN9_9ZZZZ